MFEKEIELAPPGSDRKANYEIANGVINALNGIEDALSSIYVQMGRDRAIQNHEGNEVDFPRIDTGNTFVNAVAEAAGVSEAFDAAMERTMDPGSETYVETNLSEPETFEQYGKPDKAGTDGL